MSDTTSTKRSINDTGAAQYNNREGHNLTTEAFLPKMLNFQLNNEDQANPNQGTFYTIIDQYSSKGPER